jgi:ABC-2 type transport system ATP-binding protein
MAGVIVEKGTTLMTISAGSGGGSAQTDDRAHAAEEVGARDSTVQDTPATSAPGHPPAGDQPQPNRWANEIALRAVDIGRKFGDQEAVKGVSFEVERGTIFGIIGPSGGGKTTIMRMLLGVLRPTTGELTVLDRAPHRFRRRDRERLGYMPQLFVLFPELSVHENLDFAASVYGMSWFGRGKRLRRALELVELWDVRKRTAAQLSGGMQRRLQLACTLVHNPEVVFLDEPTAGIDPVLRARFWEHFRELRDGGRTLIVTTQYVTEAEYCDRVLVLKDGQHLATGTPEEIRRQAMGGEVVTVSGPDLRASTTAVIRSVDGVLGARWAGQDRIEVIVEDAGTAVPLLMEALREANVDVDEIGEQRPSFDDVFVRLMEADDDRGH